MILLFDFYFQLSINCVINILINVVLVLPQIFNFLLLGQQQDKKPEGKEKNEQEEDLEIEIKQMINSRMLQCRNSVLASQIQKAFPGVQNPIRRNTLPAVLCEISEGSLLEESKEKKEITFKILQNSTVSDKVNMRSLFIFTHSIHI